MKKLPHPTQPLSLLEPTGGVIMALWGALTEFMVRKQRDAMVGCASIPMLMKIQDMPPRYRKHFLGA